MAESNLPAVLGRALLDPHFRAALTKDPHGTAKLAALPLTNAEAKAIAKVKPAEWDGMKLKDVQARIAAVAKGKRITHVVITDAAF